MQWHEKRFWNKVVHRFTVDYATKNTKAATKRNFQMLFEICEYEILLQIARQA